MKAVLMIGAPASGKSTLAREQYQDYIQVERDIIREGIAGTRLAFQKMDDPEKENKVTAIMNQRIEELAAAGKDIVISDTNITTKTRRGLVMMLIALGYSVTYHIVHDQKNPELWKETLHYRNNTRPVEHRVPAHVLDSFINRMNDVYEAVQDEKTALDASEGRLVYGESDERTYREPHSQYPTFVSVCYDNEL